MTLDEVVARLKAHFPEALQVVADNFDHDGSIGVSIAYWAADYRTKCRSAAHFPLFKYPDIGEGDYDRMITFFEPKVRARDGIGKGGKR